MKTIAVPAKTNTSDALVDERFGRASFFAICENEKISFIDNPHHNDGSGVGSKVVELLATTGVNMIIAPEIGPKAMQLIEKLKIDYQKLDQEELTVEQACQKFSNL